MIGRFVRPIAEMSRLKTTQQSFTSIMLLFRRGQILGCNNHYFCAGSYTIEADGFMQARIKVDHYAGRTHPMFNAGPLLGYVASVHGVMAADHWQLKGAVNGDPDRTLVITLTRLMPAGEGG